MPLAPETIRHIGTTLNHADVERLDVVVVKIGLTRAGALRLAVRRFINEPSVQDAADALREAHRTIASDAVGAV